MSVPWQGMEGFEPADTEPGPGSFPPPEPETLAPEDAEAIRDRLQPRAGRYYGKLKGLYGSIGLLTYAFDQTCGTAIIQSAEETARSMDRLARENPVVQRVVEAALKGSVFTEVFAAHTPIIMSVISHHFPNVFERLGAGMVNLMAVGSMPSDDGQPTVP